MEERVGPYSCRIISTVDFVKEVAKFCGWNGQKTPKDRKFLSDLKNILTQWNDIPYKDIIGSYEGCIWAKEFYPLEKITIRTDSAYCHNCYTQKWYKNWQKNGWKNSKKEPVANKTLWLQLIPFFENTNFIFEKVKGHTGAKDWNNEVDKLAVEARKQI